MEQKDNAMLQKGKSELNRERIKSGEKKLIKLGEKTKDCQRGEKRPEKQKLKKEMKARGKLGKLKKNKIVLPGAKQQNGWSAQNQRENKKFVNKEAVRHGLLNSRVSK